MRGRLGHFVAALVGCCLAWHADGFAGAGIRGFTTRRQGHGGQARQAAAPLAAVSMKEWSKRATLADKAGGAADKGFDAVGIEGDIPVIFTQAIRAPKAKQPLWRRIIRRPAPTPEEAAMYAAQPKWRRFLRKPAPGTAPAPAAEVQEDGQKMNTLQTMALVGQPLSAVAAQAGQYIKYKCKVGDCGTCAVRVDGQWVRTCVAKVPPMEPGTEYKVTVAGSMVETKGASAFFSFSSFVSGFKNNALGMVGMVKESVKGGKNFEDRINKEKELLAQVAARKAAKAKAEAEAKKKS